MTRSRWKTRVLPALALLLVSSTAAAGDAREPGAFWPSNVGLSRSTAMGGALSAGPTSNDALFDNPAGLAVSRRYHLQLDYASDTRFPGTGLTVSVTDSSTVTAGTGFYYQRWAAGSDGLRGDGWQVGAGYGYFSGNVYFGGVTHYLHYGGVGGDVRQFVQDIGLLNRSGDLAWALVVKNLGTSIAPLFPPTGTLGLSWGNDADFRLTADWRVDLSDFSRLRHQLAAGSELVLDQTVALRAGYTWDVSNELGSVSAGVALVSSKVQVSFTWRRRVQGPLEQFFQGAITLYLE